MTDFQELEDSFQNTGVTKLEVLFLYNHLCKDLGICNIILCVLHLLKVRDMIIEIRLNISCNFVQSTFRVTLHVTEKSRVSYL